jgi:hypothetical protein
LDEGRLFDVEGFLEGKKIAEGKMNC